MDKFGLDTLYHYCEGARKMPGRRLGLRQSHRASVYHQCGGQTRGGLQTKDYSVTPPADTIFDMVKAGWQDGLRGIGKISDIFNGKGCEICAHYESKPDGMGQDDQKQSWEDFDGLIYTWNLVDF